MQVDNDQKIDVIFCDDTRPMEPYPPLTEAEKKNHEEFWDAVLEKFLNDAVPVNY